MVKLIFGFIGRVCAFFYALILLPLVLAAVPGVTHATTLLVPENYTLEAALAAAVDGDSVSVAPNTLDGGVVELSHGITLLSRELGANRLGGMGASNLGQAQVKGFILGEIGFTGGFGEGRITVSSSKVSFADCTFENIWTGQGPPIAYGGNFELLFERCAFHENYWERITEGAAVGGNCIAPDYNAYSGTTDGSITIRDCEFQNQSSPIVAIVPVTIEGTRFLDCGPFLIDSAESLEMFGCLVAHFGVFKSADYLDYECLGVTDCIWATGGVVLQGNTFVDTTVPDAPVMTPCWDHVFPPEQLPAMIEATAPSSGVIENNLFIGLPAAAVEAPASVSVGCNDFWEIDGPNTRGGIGDVTKSNDNISAPPIFCARWAGDYTLSTHSPASAENSACGRMGAYDSACEITPVLVQGFTGTRVEQGVKLQWSLSGTQEVFLRRLDESASAELYRGQGASGVYLDTAAPAGELRYGLGIMQDGEEIFPLETLRVAANEVPTRTVLLGAFPNPFNPRTEIRFLLDHAQVPTIRIYDAAGRRVHSFPAKRYPVGAGAVSWNGRDDSGRPVASGIYFVQMIAEGKQLVQRLALLR